MQVVDSHIHLWDLKTHRYPWLENPGVSFVGDARDLKHDYLLDDLLGEAGDIDVLKLVHVEANHDPADPVEETRWLQSIADREESRGMPNAIVAAVDLSAPGKAPKADRAELENFLQSTKAIPTDGIVKAQAGEITRGATADVKTGRWKPRRDGRGQSGGQRRPGRKCPCTLSLNTEDEGRSDDGR